MLLDKIIEYKAYFIKKSSVHLSSIFFELHVKFLIFLLCKAFIVLVLQFLGIIHTFNQCIEFLLFGRNTNRNDFKFYADRLVLNCF